MLFGGAHSDPIAFQVGAFGIHWYALIIIFGVLAGFWIAQKLATRSSLPKDLLWDFLLYAIPASIIGGRLVFVLSHLSQFENVGNMLKVWEGGISSHGVIGASVIVALILAKRKKIPFFKLTDILAPGVAIAQAIGRWGNYMNQEAFGSPTDVWWAVPIDIIHRPAEFASSMYFHPTWLYESLWSILIFLALYFLFRKLSAKQGAVTAMYFLLYYVGRFVLDFFRLDTVQAGFFTATQWVGVVVIIGAVVFLMRFKKQAVTP